MKQHYVYRITIQIPNDERKYYVGKHSGLLNDLETRKYKTSSKIVRPLLESGIDFKYKIVATFKTSKDALAFESRYHKRLNVKSHPLFYNQSNQTSSKFEFSPDDKVYVTNKQNGEKITLTKEEYKNCDKNIFESHAKGYVSVIDKEGNRIKVTSEEYRNNKEKYITGQSNKILVIDKEGNRINITTEEYKNNKEKYTHCHLGKQTYKNKYTGEYKMFYKNEVDESVWVYMFYGKKLVKNKITGETSWIDENEFDSEIHVSPLKGKARFKNKETGEIKMLSLNEEHNGWLRYTTKGKKLMTNRITGERKMLYPDEIDRNLWRFKNEIS